MSTSFQRNVNIRCSIGFQCLIMPRCRNTGKNYVVLTMKLISSVDIIYSMQKKKKEKKKNENEKRHNQ